MATERIDPQAIALDVVAELTDGDDSPFAGVVEDVVERLVSAYRARDRLDAIGHIVEFASELKAAAERVMRDGD